jgi:DNA-binding NtrC family response regulator
MIHQPESSRSNAMNVQEISILIIDDDKSVRTLLECALNVEYRCTTASSAEEATGLLAGKHFSLVLTDLNIPGASGLEICQMIKQTSPQTRVVIMSGMGGNQGTIEAERRGECDYLTKPFDLSQIRRVIRHALSLSK